jgi:filamentous hemagglutinin family protein
MKAHASFNRCYRLLWSGTTEQWKPVPETARTASKGGSGKAASAITLAGVLPGVAMSLFVMSNLAAQPPPMPPAPSIQQLPTNGQVVGGQASISQSAIATAANMVVNQSSQRAIIDWGSFNIGSQASVQFVQPNAQSVILNRVLDPNPTQVFGRINANGQVFITNPYGVYFAPGASVDVGGLVATTYNIRNEDFMSGYYRFEQVGGTGRVVNEGSLRANAGGYIAMLAPEVQNSGVVLARAGTVAFAAGDTVTLTIADGKSLSGITTTASALASLIENKLAVQAPDGQIILSAVALNKLQAGVIKNSGSLQATSLSAKGGKIVLEADEIELTSTAAVDVSGRSGGGTVLMGGDWQGSGTLRQATQVRVANGASINASATDSGDGGKVVLWSNVSDANSSTSVHGSIQANAGPNGGKGGQIETSGHYLNVDDIQVSTQAPRGATGEWLLDPADITIVNGLDTNNTNANNTFSPNSSNTTSNISNVTLSNALSNTSITVTTTNNGTAASSAGNISVTSNLSWSNANTLTLVANDSISGSAAASINMTGGGSLVFETGNASTTNAFVTVIKGNGSVTKQGVGNLILSGNNTYSGNTTVSAGTLTDSMANTTATLNVTTGNYSFTSSGVGTGVVKVLTGATLNTTVSMYNNIEIAGSGASGKPGALALSSGSANGAILLKASGSVIGGSGAIYGDITEDVASSGLTVNSTGSINFYGTKSYTGNTNINGGNAVWLNTINSTTSATFNTSFNISSGSSLKFNLPTGAGTEINITGDITGAGHVETNALGNLSLMGRLLNTGNISIVNGTISLKNNGDYTVSGNIKNTYNLTQAGTGNVTLTGNSTGFTGNLTINAGGTVTIGDGNTSGIVNAKIADNGTLNFNRSDNITVSSAISGTGLINKLGSNVLSLSGNNTFSGAINVSAGTLKSGFVSGTATYGAFGTNANITLVDATGVSLDINGTTTYVSGLTGGINTTLNISTPSTFWVGTSNASSTFTGQITGSGTLNKIGTGTFTLSGCTSSYTGGINIGTGTLSLAAASDTTIKSVFTGSGNLTQTGPGNVTLTANSTSFNGNLTINSGTNLTLGDGSTNGTWNASIANNGTLNFNRSDSITFSKVISGTGSLNQQGTGGLTLSGNNTYSGGTTVTAGTLTDSMANTTATLNVTTGNYTFNSSGVGTGVVKVLTGATFNTNVTVYNNIEIAGSGASGNPGALTLNATGGNVYGQVLIKSNDAVIGGSGGLYGDIADEGQSRGLTLNSTGTLNVVENKSYSGVTNITGQTASFSTGSNALSRTYNNSFNISSGSLLTFYLPTGVGTEFNISGDIIGAGNLTVANAGNLSLMGKLSNTGTINLSGGTLSLKSNSDYTLAGNITGTYNLTQAGTGNLTLTGNSTGFTGNLTINAGGTVTIGNGSTSGTVNSSIQNNGTLNFNRTVALTIPGAISGTGALNKLGSNVLTLSNSGNNYTGNTTIQQGTLKASTFGNGSNVSINDEVGNGIEISALGVTFGSLQGGVNTTVNVSTFGLTAGSKNLNTTFAGALLGSGTFTKSGTGSLTLSGNSSAYTGNISSSGTGALVLTNTSVIGNRNKEIQITGDGGVLELQNITNFANAINITNNASLLVNSDNSSVAGNLTIAAGKSATLNVTAGLNLTLAGRLNSSGVVNKNTDGWVTFSGNNSAFTGTLNISKGVLILANNLSLGATSGINTGNITLGTCTSAPSDTGNGTTWLNASDTTLLNNLTLTASGAISGNANLNVSNSSYRFNLSANNSSSLSGTISGPGLVTLGTSTNRGAWNLSGASTVANISRAPTT